MSRRCGHIKVQHQCPWCGYDLRSGEHGTQEDAKDGGVNVFCKVKVHVHHPARVFRIEGVTT